MTSSRTTSTSPVVLRPATAADTAGLRDLAALDSSRLPAGPFLVAEVDGSLHAAVSTRDGAAVADPFRHTAALVALLRARIRQTSPAVTERRVRLGRRPRFAPAL